MCTDSNMVHKPSKDDTKCTMCTMGTMRTVQAYKDMN